MTRPARSLWLLYLKIAFVPLLLAAGVWRSIA